MTPPWFTAVAVVGCYVAIFALILRQRRRSEREFLRRVQRNLALILLYGPKRNPW